MGVLLAGVCVQVEVKNIWLLPCPQTLLPALGGGALVPLVLSLRGRRAGRRRPRGGLRRRRGGCEAAPRRRGVGGLGLAVQAREPRVERLLRFLPRPEAAYSLGPHAIKWHHDWSS